MRINQLIGSFNGKHKVINQSINQSISQSINQSIGSFVLDKSVNNKLYTWQLKWEKKDDQTTNSKLFNVKKMFPLIQ